jgi:protease-4
LKKKNNSLTNHWREIFDPAAQIFLNSDEYANAHIFSAQRAKEVGLIDEIGIISQAKSQLATLAQVKTPRWKQKDKLEKFIDKLTQKTLTHIQAFGYGLKAEF